MTGHSNGKIPLTEESNKTIIPKVEAEDYELPASTILSEGVVDNAASSSGSNLRSFFIGMGFLPSLVDKVIEENGEDNAELLLETLFSHSALQKSNPQSSDSLDDLFNDKDSPEVSTLLPPKEELEEVEDVTEDKRKSLLRMNFSANVVDFSINKLGEDASVNELVDFIIAAQVAIKIERETDDSFADQVKNEDGNEKLFRIMEKTLQLLKMGFSEKEVSSAIERLGSDVPVLELADFICRDQNGTISAEDYKFSTACGASHLQGATGHRSFSTKTGNGFQCNSYNTVNMKAEDFSMDEPSYSRNYGPSHSRNVAMDLEQICKGKRPKEEVMDEAQDIVPHMRSSAFEVNRKGKRPKQEQQLDDLNTFPDSFWLEEKIDAEDTKFGTSIPFKTNPSRRLNSMAVKPPYFFYSNALNTSRDSWAKISQFLYAVEPEFVDTGSFSAFSRTEGYVHNLPIENRFRILAEPPMTIQDAMPHTKKWWASWDTRKQLSCISSEYSGVLQVCDRLGRVIADSSGNLSSEQQRRILHQCRTSNLVWVGRYKLGPVEPEQLEDILGFPLNHTEVSDSSMTERLQSLKHSFQTDTLGYHLSGLKLLFPGGLTVLSLFSGIGGAEVALHRLGIRLKAVVSVESSETKRKVLRRWWHNTGQTGELVQIEDIQRLTSNKLDNLIKRFGNFDFVICQSPFSNSKKNVDGDRESKFDFPLFFEFVRVLQRVRSLCENA